MSFTYAQLKSTIEDYCEVSEATFTSNVTIDGTLSVNAANAIIASLTGDVTGDLTGNVRAQSGISTFNDVLSFGT